MSWVVRAVRKPPLRWHRLSHGGYGLAPARWQKVYFFYLEVYFLDFLIYFSYFLIQKIYEEIGQAAPVCSCIFPIKRQARGMSGPGQKIFCPGIAAFHLLL
ncbi:MAG: hypothetical protein ACTFAK_12455 [Candidatus Electronema sp. VV]